MTPLLAENERDKKRACWDDTHVTRLHFRFGWQPPKPMRLRLERHMAQISDRRVAAFRIIEIFINDFLTPMRSAIGFSGITSAMPLSLWHPKAKLEKAPPCSSQVAGVRRNFGVVGMRSNVNFF